MFRTKICGITRVQDAELCRDAGADAIGLNFYPDSPRYLDQRLASRIAEAVGADLWKVGVFVNATVEEILEISRRIPLDAVQLHGDEPPDLATPLSDLAVIKAFREKHADWRHVARFAAATIDAGSPLAAVLVDAHEPGRYGGTGKTLDWPAVADLCRALPDTRVILAGGLRPENVAAAIQAAMPFGVDTASGVESSPGIKHADQVKGFVRNARAAFAQLGVA